MARDLGVDYVLDGSVAKSGDDLRVTLHLVEVDSEESLWSERYKGNVRDIFEIQEGVARAVAELLPVQIGSDELEALIDRRTEDPRVVESYLRAHYEMWKFSSEGLENAERHLRNSLSIVGDDALVFATLGTVYTQYAQIGLDPDGSYLGQAAKCVERVFELQPGYPRGYLLEAQVRFHAGDMRSARAPLERAIEGTPNEPDVLVLLGYLCALSGQHERGRELLGRLLEVDPLTPFSHASQGFIDWLEGRPKIALPAYRTSYEMDPHSPFAAWCYGWMLLQDGQVAEAEPVFDDLAGEHPDSLFASLGLAFLHAVRGDRASALATLSDDLRRAAKTTELFSRELARCLALAEEIQEALDWLENTIRIGNVDYPFYSQRDPWLANVRSEPRFAQLMEQVEREWKSLNPHLAT
jgi:tetratricopeptide (TPR) repeat protein